ncbi:MAG: hypothetical protein WBE86_16995 [Candidatus Acidiferrales bacterium]
MRLPHSDSRRTRGSFLAALFLFAGLCGCAVAPQSQSSDPPDSPSGNLAQPSAQILFCDVPGTSCSPASSFSVSKLRDLNIVVNWSNLSVGNHAQTLAVLHTAGGLYQSFHKGFLVSSEAGGSFSTSNALPVAGTWIVHRSLTGSWTVQASLDGQIVATQSVTLTP